MHLNHNFTTRFDHHYNACVGFSNIAYEVICIPSLERGRALITRGFGEHATVMEDLARVLSKNERLTLLRLLKIGETGGRDSAVYAGTKFAVRAISEVLFQETRL